MKTAEEWAKEYNTRYTELDKEADRVVGDGVVPSEDIHEIIIKQIQLDAMKEGARRAKIKCDSLAEKAIEEGWPHTYADAQMLGKAILTAANNWTEKDL